MARVDAPSHIESMQFRFGLQILKGDGNSVDVLMVLKVPPPGVDYSSISRVDVTLQK